MPLLDHFHPPLSQRRHWESFHSAWATKIADVLNEKWMPEGYIAEENTHAGASTEIDVATFEEPRVDSGSRGGATATLPARVWSPPAPDLSLPTVFPKDFEVEVYNMEGGYRLVAAIELVSPGNKDRPETRQAFVAKCTSLLQRGVWLVIVDIVTSRQANLYDEIVRCLNQEAANEMIPGSALYAAAYQPVRRHGAEQIDCWSRALALGQPLPQMPLALRVDLVVPVDLDSTYMDVCRRRGWLQ
jgi:hypothetical protein